VVGRWSDRPCSTIELVLSKNSDGRSALEFAVILLQMLLAARLGWLDTVRLRHVRRASATSSASGRIEINDIPDMSGVAQRQLRILRLLFVVLISSCIAA
jgi:hypothetical protein